MTSFRHNILISTQEEDELVDLFKKFDADKNGRSFLE